MTTNVSSKRVSIRDGRVTSDRRVSYLSCPDLASRIKQLRRRKYWMQHELAEQSGVSMRMIQEIERGRSSPTIRTLEKICQALEITMSDLFYKMDG